MNHAPELLIARGFPPEAIQAIRTPGLGWSGPVTGHRTPLRIRGSIWRWNLAQSQWHVSTGGTLYHTLSAPGGAPYVTEAYPIPYTTAGCAEAWASYFSYVTVEGEDPLGVFTTDLPRVYHTFLFADSPQGARLVSVQRGKGKPREATAKLRGIVGASVTGLMGCALTDLPTRLPAGMWHTSLSIIIPVPMGPRKDRLSRLAADAAQVPLHPYHPRRLARFWPRNDCPEIVYYRGAPDV